MKSLLIIAASTLLCFVALSEASPVKATTANAAPVEAAPVEAQTSLKNPQQGTLGDVTHLVDNVVGVKLQRRTENHAKSATNKEAKPESKSTVNPKTHVEGSVPADAKPKPQLARRTGEAAGVGVSGEDGVKVTESAVGGTHNVAAKPHISKVGQAKGQIIQGLDTAGVKVEKRHTQNTETKDLVDVAGKTAGDATSLTNGVTGDAAGNLVKGVNVDSIVGKAATLVNGVSV
ncbi:uncharacterized protein VTP21DRAFT_9329 [Calcarisporiella thermophila]|uniref:uncharacterized protein n=1 Tax=Calcarisporiella thermophila TaxID=911321 RepID=UPI003742FCEF